MSTDGRAVANFVLDFCGARGRAISNLSLQKVVYFCHVWSLIEFDRPLLKHQFEAWQHGPVLPYLYREFKDFQGQPISARATRINPETGSKEIVHYAFDGRTEELLCRIVDFYSRLSSSDLVALSHVKGGPWDEVWNHREAINPGMKIKENSIVTYYSKIRPPFLIQ